MRVKQVQFSQGSFYHLYNHAAKGELLFKDPKDYDTCINLLTKYINKDYFELGAYCLMPNHYHLLIRQLTSAQVTQPLFQIWQRYSRYYNKKYDQFGSIFCEKLQHVWINSENYLLTLCAYIHLNPVKAKLIVSPELWQYSDYLDWMGLRTSGLFNPALRNTYYHNNTDYQELIQYFSPIGIEKRLLIDD